MGIREGVARAVDTFVDMNMRVFMEIADVSKKMGYIIDTAENRVVFAIGLLVAQMFYSYQVYPQEKAEYISKLTEYFLGHLKTIANIFTAPMVLTLIFRK